MDALAKKFQVKDGYVGRLVDVPEEAAALFADWPKNLATKKTKDLDFILAFVASAADIHRQATRCVKMSKPDSLLWFAYPKRSSGVETDISRDHGWEPLDALGYRPVRQIAVDATWSAVRFREKSLVKKE